jgi:hypothetical protein
MKLSTIMNQLTQGEFAQLSIGGQPTGEINAINYPQIAAHINLGLTALYTRFNLKQRRVVINLQPGLTRYLLNSKYAQSATLSQEPVKYLADLNDPFTDDVIQIQAVLTDAGDELYLNKWAEPYSVMTPSQTTLDVPSIIVNGALDMPEELRTENLIVQYQATHTDINEDTGLDFPEDMDVDLPNTHLTALLYFVAGRFNTPLGAADGFHAGNNYATMYEAECLRLENKGMVIVQQADNNLFRQKGWR